MTSRSLRLAAVLVAALSGAGCSDSLFGPQHDGPTKQETTTQTTSSTEMPGPGEPCYPELHGPTCVPNENSRTGYAIAN